jgi:hypothetical protein
MKSALVGSGDSTFKQNPTTQGYAELKTATSSRVVTLQAGLVRLIVALDRSLRISDVGLA